jgi:methylmalonyl-CoA mutase N-terminal domain/subunit
VENKRKIVVGVNRYVMQDEELDIPLLKVDKEVEDKQRRELDELRKERDNDKVARSLAALSETASGSDNLIPAILECSRCYCTEGEIMSELKKVFGEYQEPIFL